MQIAATINQKRRARALVNYRIQTGQMVRQSCERCGGFGKRIEAHHEDYSKPLNVVWLCSSCHRAIHVSSTCRNGHELTGENIYVSPKNLRGCRTCRKEQARRAEARRQSIGRIRKKSSPIAPELKGEAK